MPDMGFDGAAGLAQRARIALLIAEGVGNPAMPAKVGDARG